MGGLAVEHFGGKVIDSIAVVAGESTNEASRIAVIAKRQCGQLQPGDPTLSACLKGSQIARGDRESHMLVQECRDFFIRVVLQHLERLRMERSDTSWIGRLFRQPKGS